MIILPAIDIIDGKPVRLYQGDYAKKEVVAQSVAQTAAQFAKDGAEFLHLVDLDGAKAGRPVNQELIVKTVQSAGIPAEVGGGIRSLEDIAGYLDQGVTRVILGTAALEDPSLLQKALERWPEGIAVGIDCKNGKVCTSGWMETSDMDYLEFARQMEKAGVKVLIFTDISKDGTLQGPSLEMLKALSEAVSCRIIASGGIKDITHIEELAALNLYGAITGKAMYAGTLDLKQAIEKGKGLC